MDNMYDLITLKIKSARLDTIDITAVKHNHLTRGNHEFK